MCIVLNIYINFHCAFSYILYSTIEYYCINIALYKSINIYLCVTWYCHNKNRIFAIFKASLHLLMIPRDIISASVLTQCLPWLQYRSPRRSLESRVSSPYSLSPVGNKSQKLLRSPRKVRNKDKHTTVSSATGRIDRCSH